MTWQWVTIILGVLAVLVAQGYINVLKARIEIAARSLGIPQEPGALEHVNGSST